MALITHINVYGTSFCSELIAVSIKTVLIFASSRKRIAQMPEVETCKDLQVKDI